jgi:hypothetical protein
MAINDAKAAKSPYEKFLLSHRIPRQFWKYGVASLEFVPYTIGRKIDGHKKLKEILAVSAEDQQSYWQGLTDYVGKWQPDSADSPAEQFVVFCCEDEKTAQHCLFTLAHYMLQGLYRRTSRYRLVTQRNYELWKLLQSEEALDLPNVVLIPSIMSEITNAQYATLREMFTLSFRIFAATSLSPQEFFERFNYLPTMMFYVESIKTSFDVQKTFG